MYNYSLELLDNCLRLFLELKKNMDQLEKDRILELEYRALLSMRAGEVGYKNAIPKLPKSPRMQKPSESSMQGYTKRMSNWFSGLQKKFQESGV